LVTKIDGRVSGVWAVPIAMGYDGTVYNRRECKIDEYEDALGVIPAHPNIYAIFAVRNNDASEYIMLGVEYPNCKPPDWSLVIKNMDTETEEEETEE